MGLLVTAAFVLGALYATICAVAVGRLGRIHYYSKPITTQKVFHVLIIIVCGGARRHRRARAGAVCAHSA